MDRHRSRITRLPSWSIHSHHHKISSFVPCPYSSSTDPEDQTSLTIRPHLRALFLYGSRDHVETNKRWEDEILKRDLHSLFQRHPTPFLLLAHVPRGPPVDTFVHSAHSFLTRLLIQQPTWPRTDAPNHNHPSSTGPFRFRWSQPAYETSLQRPLERTWWPELAFQKESSGLLLMSKTRHQYRLYQHTCLTAMIGSIWADSNRLSSSAISFSGFT